MSAHDARPDEIRVAKAIERLAKVAPSLVSKTLRRTWAGSNGALGGWAPLRAPLSSAACLESRAAGPHRSPAGGRGSPVV